MEIEQIINVNAETIKLVATLLNRIADLTAQLAEADCSLMDNHNDILALRGELEMERAVNNKLRGEIADLSMNKIENHFNSENQERARKAALGEVSEADQKILEDAHNFFVSEREFKWDGELVKQESKNFMTSSHKITTIKAVRTVAKCDLREAKDFVEAFMPHYVAIRHIWEEGSKS